MHDETSSTNSATAVNTLPLRSRVLAWVQGMWRACGHADRRGADSGLRLGCGQRQARALGMGTAAREGQGAPKEIDVLQQENAHLRDHVDRLKTDPGAIEHEAREQLHYAKPGEVIYNLPRSRRASAREQVALPYSPF